MHFVFFRLGTMTAGAIIVPAIVPLRPPIPGKSKLSIDTNTKIELSTGNYK